MADIKVFFTKDNGQQISFEDRRINITNSTQSEINTIISGSQGLAGVDGSKIFSSNTDPTNDVGVNGDYFINKTTRMFYGPKENNTWDLDGILLSTDINYPSEFVYDTNGVLLRINNSDTKYTEFHYDTNGVLTSMTDGSTNWIYHYDTNGVLLNIEVIE